MSKKEAEADVFDTAHTIFSENHKISPRQIRRALTLELFGVSSLLLPPYLAGECGILGIPALAVGGTGAALLTCLWDKLSESCDFNGDCAASGKASGDRAKADGGCEEAKLTVLQRIFLVLGGIGLLEAASYVLYLLTVVMRDQLLNSRYEAAILITLSIAGVFGLWRGLESRIRIYEVLFWILLVPLAAILLIACVSVHPVYWVHTTYTFSGFGKSCGISFLVFSLSSMLLFFKPHCNPPQKAAKSARVSIYLALGLNAAVYLILLGIFQDRLLAQLEFPVILLMAVVKLPGEFLERQDAFMVGIWFFCLFALFHSVLYYGKEMIQHLFPEKTENSPGYTLLFCIICGAAVFAMALLLLRHETLAGNWGYLIFCRIGPMLLVLPVLYYLCRRRL